MALRHMSVLRQMASVYGLTEQGESEPMKSVVCKDNCMNSAVSSAIEAIVQSVDAEFSSKAELFKPIVVRMDSRQGAEFEATKWPGVYAFIDERGRCLKVGKSHLNASKRALEHCRDNTTSKDGTVQMADHLSSDKTYMLVFAIQEQRSLHWVLALEHYLEEEFSPQIRSRRNG